ncbi:DUF3761 domain-containing protein [Serratia sp. CY76391]|uniref:DUF3761 domain-containing protein n=1 Tax=Serratia sp. CY76391 TaxID=3383681 RepID=UPI003FA15CF6
MRILPLAFLVCGFILSSGTMAASPAKKDAQQSVDVQQTTDIPAPKKASHPRKPKADNITLQPADTAPAIVRDNGGRFVKKVKTLPAPAPAPAPAQKQNPTPVPIPAPKSVPTPAAAPNATEAGATARCKDGSFSHSQQHSGSCSRHGGVAQWLN